MSSNIQTTAIRQTESAPGWPAPTRRFTANKPARVEKLWRSGERRASHRYAIDLPVQYEIGRGERAQSGRGRVINISSTGLLLESDRPLTEETPIRLRVEWPARLNNSVPLTLHIEGRAVRAKGLLVAVTLMKSEFRIRPCHQTAAARQAV